MNTPSPQLLKDVRAELVARGSSLKAYCERNGFVREAVTAALSGRRAGPKSVALAQRFLEKMRGGE